jgi:hypothetical protein
MLEAINQYQDRGQFDQTKKGILEIKLQIHVEEIST